MMPNANDRLQIETWYGWAEWHPGHEILVMQGGGHTEETPKRLIAKPLVVWDYSVDLDEGASSAAWILV